MKSEIISCMVGLCVLIYIITRATSYRRGFQDGLKESKGGKKQNAR